MEWWNYIVWVAEIDRLQDLVGDSFDHLLRNTAKRVNIKSQNQRHAQFMSWQKTHPLGLATSSSRTVRSQYSKTKWSFCFRRVLKTSIKFTRFSCFKCWKMIKKLRLECAIKRQGKFLYEASSSPSTSWSLSWRCVEWPDRRHFREISLLQLFVRSPCSGIWRLGRKSPRLSYVFSHIYPFERKTRVYCFSIYFLIICECCNEQQ